MITFHGKSFNAGGERFTFAPRRGISDIDPNTAKVYLCNTDFEIPYTEMETAIAELQAKGQYKGFVVAKHIQEMKERKERIQRKFDEEWERVQAEIKLREEIMQAVIDEIKQYCDSRQDIICLVYNRLEKMIEEGYFMVYTELQEHEVIKLVDIGIEGYADRVARLIE